MHNTTLVHVVSAPPSVCHMHDQVYRLTDRYNYPKFIYFDPVIHTHIEGNFTFKQLIAIQQSAIFCQILPSCGIKEHKKTTYRSLLDNMFECTMEKPSTIATIALLKQEKIGSF
jgi:hypothetical protein